MLILFCLVWLVCMCGCVCVCVCLLWMILDFIIALILVFLQILQFYIKKKRKENKNLAKQIKIFSYLFVHSISSFRVNLQMTVPRHTLRSQAAIMQHISRQSVVGKEERGSSMCYSSMIMKCQRQIIRLYLLFVIVYIRSKIPFPLVTY